MPLSIWSILHLLPLVARILLNAWVRCLPDLLSNGSTQAVFDKKRWCMSADKDTSCCSTKRSRDRQDPPGRGRHSFRKCHATLKSLCVLLFAAYRHHISKGNAPLFVHFTCMMCQVQHTTKGTHCASIKSGHYLVCAFKIQRITAAATATVAAQRVHWRLDIYVVFATYWCTFSCLSWFPSRSVSFSRMALWFFATDPAGHCSCLYWRSNSSIT